MGDFFQLLTDNHGELTAGFWVTIRLVVFAFAIAMIVGTLVAALRIAPNKWLQRLGGVYVETFRNTPLLVLLFISFASAGLHVHADAAASGVPAGIPDGDLAARLADHRDDQELGDHRRVAAGAA
jgi:glutamate transport system permease protein